MAGRNLCDICIWISKADSDNSQGRSKPASGIVEGCVCIGCVCELRVLNYVSHYISGCDVHVILTTLLAHSRKSEVGTNSSPVIDWCRNLMVCL